MPCVAAALVLSACGGTDNAAPVTSAAPDTSAPSSEPNFVRTSDGSVVDPPGDTASIASDLQTTIDSSGLTSTTIDLAEAAESQIVPETGVPGIDSTDAFCRSWSEFAGSFQALALVSAVGEPENAQMLEVVASQAIADAVAGLGAHLPPELEAERTILTVDFAGPMLRRAERALSELAIAGASDDDLLAYASLWLASLSSVGVSDPELTVDLETVNGAAVDAAVAAFAAALPSITADPSLITNAAIPVTEAYLVANCPDQGTLLGNDIT